MTKNVCVEKVVRKSAADGASHVVDSDSRCPCVYVVTVRSRNLLGARVLYSARYIVRPAILYQLCSNSGQDCGSAVSVRQTLALCKSKQ